MIRKLLFSMVMCAFAVSASAQPALVRKMPKMNTKKQTATYAKLPAQANKPTATGMWVNVSELNASLNTPRQMAPTRAEQQFEAEYWWAYGIDGALTAYNLQVNYPSTFDFATFLPAGYEGAVIDSVAFFIADKSAVSNVKVWVGDGCYADITQSNGGCQDVTTLHDFSDAPNHTNYVKLNKPYTVTADGCAVGYSFTMSEAAGPLVVWCGDDENPEEEIAGATIVRHNDITGGQWMTAYGANWGNVAILAHVKIPEVPISLQPVALVESTTLAGQKAQIATYVENTSFKTINDFSYVLTVDGVAQPEQTVTLEKALSAKGTYGFYAEFTPESAGYIALDVEITKVNGEKNNAEVKKISGGVIVIEKSANRVAVAEEFTGTWCQYCPPGHVGLANLKRDLGSSVITLAGHADGSATAKDPMQCNDYLAVVNYWASGFPDMTVNRCYSGNPYAGLNETYEYGATQLVNAVNQVFPSEATVSMTADWTGADSTAIAVTAKAQFLYDRWGGTGEDYGFAFILSEDDMSGSSSEWLQVNAFSGAQGLPADLAVFTNGSQYVQMSYDHVVVAAWDALAGKKGSVPEVISDLPVEYTTTLNISANTLIQKKTNLHLTVLLINRNNGSIVNAAQVPLGAGAAAGIDGVVSENDIREVARYNANGVKLSAPQKGLNIIKLNNGKTIKVMVK